MLLALLAASHPGIKKILADRGYRGDLIELVRNAFGMNVEITLSGSSHGKFIPAKGRWVAERSISWLDNFRRLCRNYEDTLEVARTDGYHCRCGNALEQAFSKLTIVKNTL